MKEIIITNEATINAEGNFYSKHCKPVVAIKKDGSEFHSFSSIHDAGAKLNISPNYISSRMSEKKPCRGWEFYDTKEIASVVGKMADMINRNAMDAQKYRAIEAEQERVRLEEEKRQNEIAKLRNRIAKANERAEQYNAKWAAAVNEANDLERELEALLDNNQQDVA